MTHAPSILVASLLVACSGARPETCTPEARGALIAVYEEASSALISRGACDAYTDVADCPAYVALETHYLAARKGICP